MTKFTTRVELHSAVSKDYDKLHDEMEKEGFTRTWETDDGTVYHLPTAEYDYRGNETKKEVLDLAIKASKRVKPSFEVFVTESNGRISHNLTEA
jgi:glucosamine 6-phosphate synthetase-like amidotransferase/phosphosugar isomerase protein